MATRQQREICRRCKAEITVADFSAGECTQCRDELPLRPMPRVRSRLGTLLRERMPKILKDREAKAKRRPAKFQGFDVDTMLARHARLIELAINRGYSVKALTGLVRAAEDAWQLNHA